MLNDKEIGRLLRAALPLPDGSARSRDAWPLILTHRQTPRWSMVDWGVAAAVVAALLLFPEWFWFLAYHL